MAQALHEQLPGVNAELSLATASDYRSRQLVDEDIVLLVTSTQRVKTSHLRRLCPYTSFIP